MGLFKYPLFRYSARNEYGEFRGGVIEAKDEDEAVNKLQAEGLVVISINVENAQKDRRAGKRRDKSRRKEGRSGADRRKKERRGRERRSKERMFKERQKLLRKYKATRNFSS